MTTAERIRQAKSQQQALLVLAEALDEIRDLVSQSPSVPHDEWGTWGGDAAAWGTAPQARAAATPPSPTPGTAAEYTAIEIPVDQAEVARLSAAYQAANEAFENGRRGGLATTELIQLQQRAEGIRGRLNLAKNPGAILPVSGDMVGDPDSIIKVETSPDGESVMVDLPPASPERKVKRENLARAIDLPGFFPVVQRQTEEAQEQIIHNFVVGGPLWLYSDKDGRDMIMSMPMNARLQLVEDVYELGDVRLAHEFARDIMKEEDEGNVDLAKDFIHSVADSGGAPFQGNGEN